MPNTTNYNWATPADTDLVSQGAAAIRTLGTAIDTTVFTNAGNAVQKTLIDAKGDLIVGSAADTAARLAVGTNNHVLTADSAATNGVKWAALPAGGGMTLLSTTSLSGTSTTVSSISQDYKDLQIVVYGATNTVENRTLRVAVNDTFDQDYTNVWSDGYVASNGGSLVLSEGATVYTDANNVWVLNYYNYTSTAMQKCFSFFGKWVGPTGRKTLAGGGTFNSTSAITSWKIDCQGVRSFNGGTILVYGVK
jgi:hypothetical protein